MMTPRTLAFFAAIVMLLASGVMYQLLARDSAELDEASARVALVPEVIGDWHAKEEASDERAFAQAGAKAFWTRSYVNEKTNASVLVILMCGRAGRMAIHTPEVCYRGAGYELHGDPTVARVGEEQFWSARFDKGQGKLRLHWAWNSQGGWECPTSPRLYFRGEPYLYKLYVSRDIKEERANLPDVTEAFLQRFLPALNETLFPN